LSSTREFLRNSFLGLQVAVTAKLFFLQLVTGVIL
jgi:hypothetical protein